MRNALRESRGRFDPVELSEPEIDRTLLQQVEGEVVLRDGVRELDHRAAEEGPRRAAAAGLRLVGIRHRDRAVVVHREVREPGVDPVGGWGAKPDGPEALRHGTERGLLAVELRPRREHGAIVKDPVDPKLEGTCRSSSTIPQSIGYSEPTILNDERSPRACSRSAIRMALRSPASDSTSWVRISGRAGAVRPEPAEAQRLLLLCDQGAAYVEARAGRRRWRRTASGESGSALAADQDSPRRELGAAGIAA